MGSSSPFGDMALKAKIADLSTRLVEAEEALELATAMHDGTPHKPDLDKHQLHETQQKLAMERNLLHTLIDIVPDHIFVRDRSYRHILNNRSQLVLLRAKTLEETLGKTDYDFYPHELARRFHTDNEKVMTSGVPLIDSEEMIPGPDGSPLWLATTKVPLRDSDGNVIGLVGIARDITERKQSVQMITEQAAIIDQAHDSIILMDLGSHITYLNGAAEKLLGWKLAEVAGKKSTDLYPPEDQEALRRASEETISKGEWHGALRVHTKQGKEIYLDTRRSLITDATGDPKAQLSISADITERRKNEAVALRNQRLESLGTLAGGIAHDLNNVLAPILMSIALLKLKVVDESGQRLLGMLELNAERGAQLVRQVLAFGRGAEGDRILVQPLHIAREIEQIVHDTFPKTIQFDLKYGNDLWTIIGDPTQLHQVLLNLCVNARDAMPTGGRITILLENTAIDETFASMNAGCKPGPHVAISVSDTGSGIPSAVRERIFEPFFTTKDIGKGTGLGLSTSLGIVQNHGGFINVTSDVGKGSTFKIYLPANTQDAVKKPAGPMKGGLPRGHNELILVVDDEEPILSVAKSTLERFGYRVVTAMNGAAAVSIYALERDGIAAVLTDMAMPIMDGPAMAVALKAINPNVKIIGSSGLGTSGGSNVATNVGVMDFISKPYTAEIMLKTIARVLGKKEEGQDAKAPVAAAK
jgi:two-component system cell cycle sensor histidine kinase/response regulator CckA